MSSFLSSFVKKTIIGKAMLSLLDKLTAACAILKYEIEFVNSENEISGNTYNLTNAIYALNSYTRKELEGATMGEY